MWASVVLVKHSSVTSLNCTNFVLYHEACMIPLLLALLMSHVYNVFRLLGTNPATFENSIAKKNRFFCFCPLPEEDNVSPLRLIAALYCFLILDCSPLFFTICLRLETNLPFLLTDIGQYLSIHIQLDELPWSTR